MHLDVLPGDYVVAELAWRNVSPASATHRFRLDLKNRGRMTVTEPDWAGLPLWTPSTAGPGAHAVVHLWNRIPSDWPDALVDYRIVMEGKDGPLAVDEGAAEAPVQVAAPEVGTGDVRVDRVQFYLDGAALEGQTVPAGVHTLTVEVSWTNLSTLLPNAPRFRAPLRVGGTWIGDGDAEWTRAAEAAPGASGVCTLSVAVPGDWASASVDVRLDVDSGGQTAIWTTYPHVFALAAATARYSALYAAYDGGVLQTGQPGPLVPKRWGDPWSVYVEFMHAGPEEEVDVGVGLRDGGEGVWLTSRVHLSADAGPVKYARLLSGTFWVDPGKVAVGSKVGTMKALQRAGGTFYIDGTQMLFADQDRDIFVFQGGALIDFTAFLGTWAQEFARSRGADSWSLGWYSQGAWLWGRATLGDPVYVHGEQSSNFFLRLHIWDAGLGDERDEVYPTSGGGFGPAALKPGGQLWVNNIPRGDFAVA